MFNTVAGGLRKGCVVTQIVAQAEVGHVIHLSISGEHQAQGVTVTEGGLQVLGVSCTLTGAAVSCLC